MKHDFDREVSRSDSNSFKWDDTERMFGKAGLLPFWVADMDFATPQPILEAIRERSQHPVLGYEKRTDEYRNVVLDWLRYRHGWEVPSEWLMFCPPSSIVGIHGLITMLTEEGSSIAVQSPTYGPLQDLIVQNGRRLVKTVFGERDGRYRFDVDDLAGYLEADTRMFILCSPHNPVGRVFDADELSALAQLADERELVVVSDEVHADLVMPGFRHQPYGSIGGERSVTVVSPNKTFNTAGIPQATLVIPDASIRDRFQTFLNTTQLNHDSTFGAVGMMAGYRDCREWLDEVVAYVADNHRRVAGYLDANVPGVRSVVAEATYLAWLDCRETGLGEAEIMQRLIEKGGVALYGGSEFGAEGDGYFRMNVACPRATLERGLEGIRLALG